MAQWYYTQNGQQSGPVDEAQLRGLMASGQVGPADLVWKDGMAAWQPTSAVPELSGAAAQVPTYGTQQYGQPQQYFQPQYGAAQPGQQLNYGGYASGVSYKNDAQTAMICSIIGVCCCVIVAIIGLVLGTKAKNNMRASGNTDGEGMATAAIVIGWISIGLTVVGVIIEIGLMALQSH